MEDVWSRIEERFRQLPQPEEDEDVDEDASGLEFLKPGASEEEIAEFEEFVGRKLPEDFRQSLARHNGTVGSAPYGPRLESFDQLLDIESMKRNMTVWRELLAGGDLDHPLHQTPEGPIEPVRWSLAWIPVVGEGTGDHYCIDLDPPAGGTFGQVFDYGHEEGPTRVLFPDFRGYLESWANDLESGAIRFTGMIGISSEWERVEAADS